MNKLKNSNVKSAKMTTRNVGVPPKMIKITLSRVWVNAPTLDMVKKLAKISNPLIEFRRNCTFFIL